MCAVRVGACGACSDRILGATIKEEDYALDGVEMFLGRTQNNAIKTQKKVRTNAVRAKV